MVTNTRQILYAAAPYEDDAVLLQIVSHAGDVRGTFKTVGQAYTRYFTQSGVRLFRCKNTNRGADTTALGALLEDRGVRLLAHLLTALAN